KIKDHSKEKLRKLNEVVQASENLKETVSSTIDKGNFPLVLGGDHSIAIGTIAGVLEHYSNPGLIWYDAHGDINTADTSPSGNIHGMRSEEHTSELQSRFDLVFLLLLEKKNSLTLY